MSARKQDSSASSGTGSAGKGDSKTSRKTTDPGAQNKSSAAEPQTSEEADTGAEAKKLATAIGLLEKDNRQVEELFEAYGETKRRAGKERLVRQICSRLVVHAQLEEDIFYPACREQLDDDTLLDEAQVRQDGAKVLINELIDAAADDPFFDAKVNVLAAMIRHHNAEEEGASGLFAKARQAEIDSDDMAQRLTARRTELMNRFGQEKPERPRPRSFTFQMEKDMSRRDYRERDDHGRFVREDNSAYRGRHDEDDHNHGRYGRESRDQARDQDGYYMRERDNAAGRYSRDRQNDRDGYRAYGRSSRDDDEREYRQDRYGERQFDRDRDYRGRYMSPDQEDDSGSSYRRGRYEDDDRGDERVGRGWYGDSEGHARAARRGWEERDDESRRQWQGRATSDDERRSTRDREFDTDDRSDRGRSQSGWYGDSEGHSRAARRGWRDR